MIRIIWFICGFLCGDRTFALAFAQEPGMVIGQQMED